MRFLSSRVQSVSLRTSSSKNRTTRDCSACRTNSSLSERKGQKKGNSYHRCVIELSNASPAGTFGAREGENRAFAACNVQQVAFRYARRAAAAYAWKATASRRRGLGGEGNGGGAFDGSRAQNIVVVPRRINHLLHRGARVFRILLYARRRFLRRVAVKYRHFHLRPAADSGRRTGEASDSRHQPQQGPAPACRPRHHLSAGDALADGFLDRLPDAAHFIGEH